MKINANFDEAVAIHTQAMSWVPSPMAGVDRRMLDRIGDEVARATSIVRYAPGSHFSEHTHSGGEEFIVLEGVFQDEHGDYPAGTYVRNPVGTHHIPRSDDGCTIFVKLWQFDPADQDQLAIDMNSARLNSVPDLPGVSQLVLLESADELVLLEEWQPGIVRKLGEDGGAELLVLSGAITFEGEVYGKHGWIRIPPAEIREFAAGTGETRIWIKTRHLSDVTAPTV